MTMLDGKIALITGASSGIGHAAAKLFASQGASLVLSARRGPILDSLVSEIETDGGRAVAVTGDVRDESLAEKLVETAIATYGGLDIAFNNAGIIGEMKPVTEMTQEEWRDMLETNLTAGFLGAKYQIPAMVKRGGGSIMMTASVGAFHPSTTLGTYGISKLAVIGLARNLAAEYGPQGVRCNAICPAIIKTDFAKKLYEDPKTEAAAIARVPMGRLGEAEDLKGLAVFLAAPASGYITGQAMTVCGGSYMWT